MAADGKHDCSDGHLETLLRDVSSKLEQHSQRMEQSIMNQQLRLEACMRALCIEHAGTHLTPNANGLMPQLSPGTGSAQDLAVAAANFDPAQEVRLRWTATEARTAKVLKETDHVVHVDTDDQRPTMMRPSLSSGKPQSGCLASIVEHQHFNQVVGFIILLNGFLIVLDADFTARNPGIDLPLQYLIIETIFFVIFLVELLMRIQVFRFKFFAGADWRWNWFDTIVVITAAIEEIMKVLKLAGAQTGDSAEGLTMFKLMRVVKLTRAVRIVRVFKAFRELRIMVTSIIATLRTLFWSVVCTLMIMAGFAVYLVTVVSDHQATEGPNEWAQQYFASMPIGMLSLFKASTGGADWQDMSDPLWDISPIACLAFLGYISMMVYAIMNILTGICVNNANRAAEDDFDLSFHEERSKQKNVIAGLKYILHSSSTRGDGKITWSDLDKQLADEQVRALFKKIDLETWHLKSFFDMMGSDDAEEEPSVQIDSFIRGCMRLRCTVKNIDLMAATHSEEEHLTKRLHEIRDSLKLLHIVVMRNQATMHDQRPLALA